MNPLPSFARVCARRSNLVIRSTPSRSNTTLQSASRQQYSNSQNRHLTTTTIRTDAFSTETPTSSSSSLEDSFQSTSPSTQQQPPPTTSPFLLTGTISRIGTMTSCAQITRHAQIYDKFLQKNYTRPIRTLVHDPNPTGYLREGDVVEYGLWSPAEKSARLQRKADWDEKLATNNKKKRRGGAKKTDEKFRGPRFVVRRVVTPFGVGLDERMEVLTRDIVDGKAEVEVQAASKKGRAGKQHASAKVAG